jgi:hypothetical protein
MHLLLQAFELSFDVAPLDGCEAIIDLLLHPFITQRFKD